MADNFMQISHDNRYYVINKDDSLKSLLTHEELFERKDGVCYFKLMLPVLEAAIKAYDKSSNVDSFYYNDKEYWLDKATRVGLQNLANCSTDNMSLVLGSEIIELPVDKVKEFLA